MNGDRKFGKRSRGLSRFSRREGRYDWNTPFRRENGTVPLALPEGDRSMLSAQRSSAKCVFPPKNGPVPSLLVNGYEIRSPATGLTITGNVPAGQGGEAADKEAYCSGRPALEHNVALAGVFAGRWHHSRFSIVKRQARRFTAGVEGEDPSSFLVSRYAPTSLELVRSLFPAVTKH